MDLSNYPQSQRKLDTRDQQLIIGIFLTWLENQGYVICDCRCEVVDMLETSYYMPVEKTFDQLLADYCGINLDELERERLAILARLGRGEEL